MKDRLDSSLLLVGAGGALVLAGVAMKLLKARSGKDEGEGEGEEPESDPRRAREERRARRSTR